MIFRAAGNAVVVEVAAAAAAAAGEEDGGAAFPAGVAGGAAAAFGTAGTVAAAPALPSLSMTAITCWPATVAPSPCGSRPARRLRRGKLEHDLVGLDVDEILVARDRCRPVSCAS
jgi:hypothetical protein